MIRKIVLLFCAIGCFHVAMAQNTDRMPRSFKTFGFSGFGFLDFKSFVYSESQFPNPRVAKYDIHNSIYTMTWGRRWNLVESGDHFSLSIETSPNLAFSVGFRDQSSSFMSFDVPIMIGINSGTAATFRSVNLRGFSYSAGVDIMMLPLLNSPVSDGMNPSVIFCNSLKFRKWSFGRSTEGAGRELEFFAAIGQQQLEFVSESSTTFWEYRPFHFALIFRKMINY